MTLTFNATGKEEAYSPARTPKSSRPFDPFRRVALRRQTLHARVYDVIRDDKPLRFVRHVNQPDQLEPAVVIKSVDEHHRCNDCLWPPTVQPAGRHRWVWGRIGPSAFNSAPAIPLTTRS